MRRRMFVLGASLLPLCGCSPADQGAVTLDQETLRPKAVVALCEGEATVAVSLLRLEGHRRTTVWRIEGRSTGELFEVVVGEAPSGFVEEIPLGRSDLEGDLALITDTEGGVAADSEQYFQLDQLRVGVLYDGRFRSDGTSIAALRSRAQANCEPFGRLWAIVTAPIALVALTLGLAGAVAALLLSVRRRRRRVTEV